MTYNVLMGDVKPILTHSRTLGRCKYSPLYTMPSTWINVISQNLATASGKCSKKDQKTF